MFEKFLWLLFAHYVFDFSLQTTFIWLRKQKSFYVMFVHVVIWTGGICLAMKLLNMPINTSIILMLFGTHYFVDWGKCKIISLLGAKNSDVKFFFMVDQLIHVIQLFLVFELK